MPANQFSERDLQDDEPFAAFGSNSQPPPYDVLVEPPVPVESLVDSDEPVYAHGEWLRFRRNPDHDGRRILWIGRACHLHRLMTTPAPKGTEQKPFRVAKDLKQARAAGEMIRMFRSNPEAAAVAIIQVLRTMPDAFAALVNGCLNGLVVPERPEAPEPPVPTGNVPAPPGEPNATEGAAAYAAEKGVDLFDIKGGTGKDGRITKYDIDAFILENAP